MCVLLPTVVKYRYKNVHWSQDSIFSVLVLRRCPGFEIHRDISRQRLILSQLSSIIIMLQRCVISLRHRIVSYDSCVEQQQYNFLTCNYHYCEYHKQHLHYWHSVTATYSQYWSWSQRVLPWSPLHYLIHIFYSTKSS